jgi:hypothetical protein
MHVAQAACELNSCDLRCEYATRIAQPADNRGVVIKDLLGERGSSPACGDPRRRDDVFSAVRNAVKRASVNPAEKFVLSQSGLTQGRVICESDDGVKWPRHRVEALEAVPGQLNGRDLTATQQGPKLRNGSEREFIRLQCPHRS